MLAAATLNSLFTKSGSRNLADGTTTVVFLPVSTIVSGVARESRDNALGHPIGLDKGIVGWRSTNQYPAPPKAALRDEDGRSGNRKPIISEAIAAVDPDVGIGAIDGTVSR